MDMSSHAQWTEERGRTTPREARVSRRCLSLVTTDDSHLHLSPGSSGRLCQRSPDEAGAYEFETV
jgi:hypothetical protein